ncbi:MAG: 1-pyrroline-5-carboxylate dehydrogenase, partial [Myxococcales bacterium]|nr:1-pyrroline-5-carboxylate dehydrogenase [Myxococcales bacterium]
MSIGLFRAPPPVNEPVRAYAPGSPERASIKAELARQSGTQIEAAPVIGGQAVLTGDTAPMVMPHDHRHRLGVFHKAGAAQVAAAIDAAEQARPAWAALP